jgi:hypothetical protein
MFSIHPRLLHVLSTRAWKKQSEFDSIQAMRHRSQHCCDTENANMLCDRRDETNDADRLNRGKGTGVDGERVHGLGNLPSPFQ